jgi:hypothetical protein
VPTAVPVAPTPTTLSGLRSRMVGPSGVEVWGATNAVDGTTIKLTVRLQSGGRAQRVAVPAAGGRFYAKVTLEPVLRRRGLQIRARIDP